MIPSQEFSSKNKRVKNFKTLRRHQKGRDKIFSQKSQRRNKNEQKRKKESEQASHDNGKQKDSRFRKKKRGRP